MKTARARCLIPLYKTLILPWPDHGYGLYKEFSSDDIA